MLARCSSSQRSFSFFSNRRPIFPISRWRPPPLWHHGAMTPPCPITPRVSCDEEKHIHWAATAWMPFQLPVAPSPMWSGIYGSGVCRFGFHLRWHKKTAEEKCGSLDDGFCLGFYGMPCLISTTCGPRASAAVMSEYTAYISHPQHKCLWHFIRPTQMVSWFADLSANYS